MTKTKVFKLSISNDEPEQSFGMIGICSHVPDYKLTRAINKSLNLNLGCTSKNNVIQANRKGMLLDFPYYFQKDEENVIDVYLIKNNYEGNTLVPKLKQIDFFLFLGISHVGSIKIMNDSLKKIDNAVKASFIFEMSEYNATNDIIFD